MPSLPAIAMAMPVSLAGVGGSAKPLADRRGRPVRGRARHHRAGRTRRRRSRPPHPRGAARGPRTRRVIAAPQPCPSDRRSGWARGRGSGAAPFRRRRAGLRHRWGRPERSRDRATASRNPEDPTRQTHVRTLAVGRDLPADIAAVKIGEAGMRQVSEDFAKRGGAAEGARRGQLTVFEKGRGEPRLGRHDRRGPTARTTRRPPPRSRSAPRRSPVRAGAPVAACRQALPRDREPSTSPRPRRAPSTRTSGRARARRPVLQARKLSAERRRRHFRARREPWSCPSRRGRATRRRRRARSVRQHNRGHSGSRYCSLERVAALDQNVPRGMCRMRARGDDTGRAETLRLIHGEGRTAKARSCGAMFGDLLPQPVVEERQHGRLLRPQLGEVVAQFRLDVLLDLEQQRRPTCRSSHSGMHVALPADRGRVAEPGRHVSRWRRGCSSWPWPGVSMAPNSCSASAASTVPAQVRKSLAVTSRPVISRR